MLWGENFLPECVHRHHLSWKFYPHTGILGGNIIFGSWFSVKKLSIIKKIEIGLVAIRDRLGVKGFPRKLGRENSDLHKLSCNDKVKA
jgi:hypothetical protein